MKPFVIIAIITFGLITVTGYIAVHLMEDDKRKPFCENLMKLIQQRNYVILLAPGEGNACLDRGFYPTK